MKTGFYLVSTDINLPALQRWFEHLALPASSGSEANALELSLEVVMRICCVAPENVTDCDAAREI